MPGLQRYFACGDDGLAERSGAVRHRFSLSEGIIAHPQEIYGMDVVHACNGLEVQIELSSRRFMGLKAPPGAGRTYRLRRVRR